MRVAGPVIVAAMIGVVIAVMAGVGVADAGTVLLTLTLAAAVMPLSSRLSSIRDPWMWWVAPVAYLVKLVGSAARYWVLVGPYANVGDAGGYHRHGREIAEIWRTLTVPALDGSMGEGTQFIRWFTGLLYVPYTPTMLGGFFIFATLAFVGQLLFYTTFRRNVVGGHLGLYAGLVLFLPALIFWPSSIGKDSLMIFFLGVATYGLGRAFDGYRPLWLLLAAVGLALSGLVRPHIAALLAVSFAGAALLGRASWKGAVGLRRVVVLLGALALAVVSLTALGSRFELEGIDDLDPFVADIQQHTQQGGSAVVGGAVASPTDLPAAFIRVLSRPLPHEAHNFQAMVSAVENVALLGVVVWRLPWMVRRLRRVRTPYVMMSAIFTVGFVVAFSAIFNLGILTRQRAQVLPFLLAVVVALGWDAGRTPENAEAFTTAAQDNRSRPPSAKPSALAKG